MIAYNDLVADVCGFLQIRTTDLEKFNVGVALNRAQLHLLNILKPRYLVNAIRTWKGNLLNGEHAYQWPSDFLRYLQMWIDFDNPITASNIGYPAVLVGDTQLWDTSNIDLTPTTTRPKVSMGAEGGFELQPTPDADVINGWRLRYVALLPEISSTQDCLLRENLRNLLEFYATALAAGTEEYSPAIAAEFKEYYKEELELLQTKALEKTKDQ